MLGLPMAASKYFKNGIFECSFLIESLDIPTGFEMHLLWGC